MVNGRTKILLMSKIFSALFLCNSVIIEKIKEKNKLPWCTFSLTWTNQAKTTYEASELLIIICLLVFKNWFLILLSLWKFTRKTTKSS